MQECTAASAFITQRLSRVLCAMQASSHQQAWSAAEHQGDASDGAPAFTATRGAAAGSDHTDPFMDEERLKRQAAASTSAPTAATPKDPAFLEEGPGGHAPEFRAGSSSGVVLSFPVP